MAMLHGIRKKLGNGTRDSDRLRVVQILYEVHKSLFPLSNLRKINCASLIVFSLSSIGIILVFKFPR